MKLTGKVSWFGGPNDEGVAPDEGLAFIYEVEDAPELFLPQQPPGTTGLARRLDPNVDYIACRWDYDVTPRDMLLSEVAMVRSTKTGKRFLAAPADWGPHADTGRIADISPGLMDKLGIKTDDTVEVVFPYEEIPMAATKPMAVDLSHWDPADDYDAVKADGIVGVVYKATEGGGYTDPTYVSQQQAAKVAGLKWGAYHFADASDVNKQISNFMRFACPDPDELFCLDWEDNGGDTMSLDSVKKWIAAVETQLGRPGECVIYSGNTVKDLLGNTKDEFLGARRLWLAQYGSSPSVQASWDKYWLWQFTDGQVGPSPHTVDGIGACDINSFDGTPQQLAAEWANGKVQPQPVPPPTPAESVVNVIVMAPPGVTVKIRQVSGEQIKTLRRRHGRHK